MACRVKPGDDRRTNVNGTRSSVALVALLSPTRRRTPLGQGRIGRTDHFPPFGKPSRDILPAQGRNSACHVVSEAGLQDRLEGLLHFRRVDVDSQILVEIST